MNATESMKALCLAGRIILESGGETYRAEDTVRRMAQALGLQDAEVFAIPSGLFVSFTDENGQPCASLNRVHLCGTHLSRVNRINEISRRLAIGDVPPEALYAELRQAQRMKASPSRWYMPLAALITGMGFVIMFGGSWVDMLVGGVSAALTQLTPALLPRDTPTADTASTLLNAIVCALLPLGFYRLTGLGRPDAMIAAAIMPLVPGLSMTNAVQDIMRGDMVSGVAHCARAVLMAALVAGGVLVGTLVIGVTGLSEQPAAFASLGLPAQTALLAAASLMAGGGFGALQGASRHGILYGGMLGVAAYLAYWLSMALGASETLAMFIGMLLAGLFGQIAARRLKMISTVFITIAMMPLVPGLGLYRAMRAVAEGDMSGGASIAAHAMTLILMIALGIALASTLSGIVFAAHRRRKGGKTQ